jgi:hypothetical protein
LGTQRAPSATIVRNFQDVSITNQKRARQGHATRAMGPPPLGMWSLWHDMPHTFFFAPVALETALDVCFRHSSWNRAASVRCEAKWREQWWLKVCMRGALSHRRRDPTKNVRMCRSYCTPVFHPPLATPQPPTCKRPCAACGHDRRAHHMSLHLRLGVVVLRLPR